MFPQTHTRDGQSVTIFSHEQTRLGDVLCHKTTGTGDAEVWFGTEAQNAAKILQIEEAPDGTWTVWSQPTYKYFEEYAREPDEMGEWGHADT